MPKQIREANVVNEIDNLKLRQPLLWAVVEHLLQRTDAEFHDNVKLLLFLHTERFAQLDDVGMAYPLEDLDFSLDVRFAAGNLPQPFVLQVARLSSNTLLAIPL